MGKMPMPQRSNPVRGKFPWIIVCLVVAAAGITFVYMTMTAPGDGLVIYVGSSMRLPMEKCIERFEKETGISVQASYVDSGDVLANVKKAGRGDAAVLHEPYVTQMNQEGFATTQATLAYMTPVIAVAKNNPKKVAGLKSFVREDLKIGMTDAEFTTSGKIVQEALRNAGVQQQVMDRHPMQDKSSGTVVGWVQTGTLDAVTAWNAVAAGAPDKVDTIPIDPAFMPRTFKEEGLTYYNGQVPVGLVVLKTAKMPTETDRFVKFLLSPAGRAIWKQCGYDIQASPASQPEVDKTKDIIMEESRKPEGRNRALDFPVRPLAPEGLRTSA
jgi:ABC-type molybdate transport system substrate-binding protein